MWCKSRCDHLNNVKNAIGLTFMKVHKPCIIQVCLTRMFTLDRSPFYCFSLKDFLLPHKTQFPTLFCSKKLFNLIQLSFFLPRRPPDKPASAASNPLLSPKKHVTFQRCHERSFAHNGVLLAKTPLGERKALTNRTRVTEKTPWQPIEKEKASRNLQGPQQNKWPSSTSWISL